MPKKFEEFRTSFHDAGKKLETLPAVPQKRAAIRALEAHLRAMRDGAAGKVERLDTLGARKVAPVVVYRARKENGAVKGGDV